MGGGDDGNTAVTCGDKASKCLIIYHGSHGKRGNICGNTAGLGSNGTALQLAIHSNILNDLASKSRVCRLVQAQRYKSAAHILHSNPPAGSAFTMNHYGNTVELT